MGQTSWNVYSRESGETWVLDNTIYAPTQNLNLPILSTQSKNKSADGDSIFITPSTKYNNEQMEFIWNRDLGTLKDKIITYIQNQTNLKIIDHNATEYIGRFISIEPVWLVGINPDEYSLRAVFEVMSL